MVNSNVNALGVIFANTYDNLVPELVAERSMASIPFGGRYRLIDFTLSSMANAGIDNVSVIVRKNYHSLMDHLGAGREWDLTRKRGGLNIVPPFAERSVKLYSGRVDALDSILNWLEAQKERYVILSDSYIAMNFDFNKLIDAHVKSGFSCSPKRLMLKQIRRLDISTFVGCAKAFMLPFAKISIAKASCSALG